LKEENEALKGEVDALKADVRICEKVVEELQDKLDSESLRQHEEKKVQLETADALRGVLAASYMGGRPDLREKTEKFLSSRITVTSLLDWLLEAPPSIVLDFLDRMR